MKKLGLLAGDNYIDISPGSPKFDALGRARQFRRRADQRRSARIGEDLVGNLCDFGSLEFSAASTVAKVSSGADHHTGDQAAHHQTRSGHLNKPNAILGPSRRQGLVGRSCTTTPTPPSLAHDQESARSLQTFVADLRAI
jgi:hypothetical protein